MAETVNSAFDSFLADHVNLDPQDSQQARDSRDWLFGQIARFELDTSFPKLYAEYHMPYGSFARRTKKRPLDDIDLLVCLSAQGAHYNDTGIDGLTITVNPNSNLTTLCYDGTDVLSSRKVINKFIGKLSDVPQYSASDIHLDGSAAVLNLQSYDWSFDIVPAFITTEDEYGNQVFLIPDGSGHWKKTDPRIDAARVTEVNQAHDGRILDVIRKMKYWNRRPTMPSMSSYLLEALILDYYSDQTEVASEYIDFEVRNILQHIASAIFNPIYDPKGIQGDINDIPWEHQVKISDRAASDFAKAEEAIRLETQDHDHAGSIRLWREIFGDNFPIYG